MAEAKRGNTAGILALNKEPAPYWKNKSDLAPSLMTIHVNGQPAIHFDNSITYQQVLEHAGVDGNYHTVTYSKKKDGYTMRGKLSPGESVEVLNFMRFNVDRTTNA